MFGAQSKKTSLALKEASATLDQSKLPLMMCALSSSSSLTSRHSGHLQRPTSFPEALGCTVFFHVRMSAVLVVEFLQRTLARGRRASGRMHTHPQGFPAYLQGQTRQDCPRERSVGWRGGGDWQCLHGEQEIGRACGDGHWRARQPTSQLHIAVPSLGARPPSLKARANATWLRLHRTHRQPPVPKPIVPYMLILCTSPRKQAAYWPSLDGKHYS